MTLAALALLGVTTAGPAAAQSMGIVATVNSTPISEYDLRARLELVLAMSGLPRTREAVQQLAPKVVESLIDEELKRQEAKNLNIEVTDTDVERAIRRQEKARGMASGTLEKMMSQMHLPKEVLFSQIRADIGWSRALQQRFRTLTQVTDADIDEEIARLEADKGKPVVLLSEIFLPVDEIKKEGEIHQVAQKLVKELRAGTPFGGLAATFSQSPTAAVGGDQGWVSLNSLSPAVQQALANMKTGEFTDPIRTQQGYVIHWLRDRRVSQGATGPAVDPQITLQQLTIPAPENQGKNSVEEKTELAKRLKLRANKCESIADMPKQVAGGLTASKANLRMSQLSPLVREAIKDLPDNKVSEPIKVPGAIMLFMICDREKENTKDALRREIRNRLVNDRLDLAARQFLRDLRRNAFIERR